VRLEEVAAQLTTRIVAIRPSNPAARVVLDEAQDTKAKGAGSPSSYQQAPATAVLAARRISRPLYAQDKLQSPLLATKFYLPPTRADLVARPRLIERLASGLQRKLTLVSAPAGFGKTTLLSSWQATARAPYAWLALDAGDNDPVRFWTYVAAALRSICPTVQDKIAPLLQMMPLPPIESLLVSRSDPPLPLTSLRARGELTEIRAQDLRFTPDEATAFLNSVMGLRLSHAEIAALDAHTEGWAAGLQLAALSMQGRRDRAGARDSQERDLITSFTGSHRFILDYLTGEVLQQQPAFVRAFLLSTSPLDRLNAQLCNALTGQEDGQAMLERLERANLFLSTKFRSSCICAAKS
jgi:LuxR family transcriptional regulator, maltose regulon positive regulatory protein